MGQLLTCLGCHGTGTEHSVRQRTTAAAIPLAPLPPVQPPATTTSTPGANTFPFSLVHWSSNAIDHTYSPHSNPKLYDELYLISHSLATHTQYITTLTTILREFHNLLDPQSLPRSHPPSFAEVADYLQAHFPELRIWEQLDDAWGMVDKRESTNTIYLCESVFVDMEKWLTQPHEASAKERSGHRILALIILAHELVHAATKSFYGGLITPQGLGPESGGYGEAGWAGEWQLFGGYVYLEWAGGFPAFRIDRIKGFFLEDPSTGKQFFIGDRLVRWSDELRQALRSNAPFPPPPIDFATATPAPPPQPGFARNRIASNQRYSPPQSPVRPGASTSTEASAGPRYPVTGGPYHGDPYKRTRGRSEGFVFPSTSH